MTRTRRNELAERVLSRSCNISASELRALLNRVHFSAVRDCAEVAARHNGNKVNEAHIARVIIWEGKE